MTIHDELHITTIEATKTVFTASGVSCFDGGCVESPFVDAGASVVSSIGFASEQLRGNLVLVAAPAVALVLAPEESEAASVACDVMGEFANMIVGRIKTRLLRLDVRVLIGTPTSAIAERFSILSGAHRRELAWHRFVLAETHSLYVRVDAVVDPAFTFEMPRAESIPVAANGNVTLF